MSLRHAILGVLKGGPLHGYAVADELERRIAGGRYNSAQVYQGLRWLAERDFVAAADPEPGASRDRHPFFLTPKGQREFDRWLRSPFTPSRPTRDDAIVKLVFLGSSAPTQLVAFLERLKRQHLRRLAAEKPAPRRPSERSADKLFIELSAAALRFREEAELRWIDHCLLRLTDFPGEGTTEACAAADAPGERRGRQRE